MIALMEQRKMTKNAMSSLNTSDYNVSVFHLCKLVANRLVVSSTNWAFPLSFGDIELHIYDLVF